MVPREASTAGAYWKAEFASLFDRLPADAILTAVDVHS
jgi:hypothetical protein